MPVYSLPAANITSAHLQRAKCMVLITNFLNQKKQNKTLNWGMFTWDLHKIHQKLVQLVEDQQTHWKYKHKNKKTKHNQKEDFTVCLHLLLCLQQQFVSYFQHTVKQHFQCVKGWLPTYFTAPMNDQWISHKSGHPSAREMILWI